MDEDSATDTTVLTTVPLESSEPRIHPRYSDENANLELLSSDGVRFLVHKEYLWAASSVFRDMVNNLIGQPSSTNQPSARPVITLTDQKLEDASTLAVFLQLVCGDPTFNPKIGEMARIIKLGDKYDCSQPFRTAISVDLQLWADDVGYETLVAFALACSIDSAPAIKTLFLALCSANLDYDFSEDEDIMVQARGLLSPVNLSPAVAAFIPAKYLWALGRMSESVLPTALEKYEAFQEALFRWDNWHANAKSPEGRYAPLMV